jgi:hypothetical protein
MLIRFLIVLLLFSACRSGEIACPEVKSLKLRKRPGHYIRSNDSQVTASAEERKPVKSVPSPKKLKTISSIEEWDCPRPGANVIPKSVKENIKKNRKKFEQSAKQRAPVDSVSTSSSTH